MKIFTTVRAKLVFLIVLPLILTGLLGYFAIQQLHFVSSTVLNVTEQRLTSLGVLNKLSHLYSEGAIDIAHKSRAQMMLWSEAEEQITQSIVAIDEQWELYRSTSTSSEIQNKLAEAEPLIATAQETLLKLKAGIEEQSSYQIGNFVDLSLYPGLEPTLNLINELVAVEEKLAQLASSEAIAADSKAVSTIFSAVIILAIVVFAFGMFIITNINSRLGQLLNTITQIEKTSDLTLRTNLPPGDEFGDMGRRFDRMMQSLCDLMSELQNLGSQQDQELQQLIQINRTTRQQVANQQQEIISMTESISQVNESASLVSRHISDSQTETKQAGQIAKEGAEKVRDTLAAIQLVSDKVIESAGGLDELKSHSNNIGSVLDVITSIAEQTNLLALNAAIEAARAGEQGRGFAVVADEVRQLASRTSASIQESQKIIDNLHSGTETASEKMYQGEEATRSCVEQAQLSGSAIEQIQAAFDTILVRSQEIAEAAERQLSISEQVNAQTNRVGELATLAVEISESADETSQSVARHSDSLHKALSVFRTA